MTNFYREGHTGPGERGRAVRSAPVVRFAPTPPNSDRSNPHSHPYHRGSGGHYGPGVGGGPDGVSGVECELERTRGRRARERLQAQQVQRQQRASLDLLTPAPVAIGSDPRLGLGGTPAGGCGAPLAQPSMMPLSPMGGGALTPPSTPAVHSSRYRFVILHM